MHFSLLYQVIVLKSAVHVDQNYAFQTLNLTNIWLRIMETKTEQKIKMDIWLSNTQKPQRWHDIPIYEVFIIAGLF